MRIKNLIKKNIYLIIFLVIALLFVIAYFKSTEGFQEGYYYVGIIFAVVILIIVQAIMKL